MHERVCRVACAPPFLITRTRQEGWNKRVREYRAARASEMVEAEERARVPGYEHSSREAHVSVEARLMSRAMEKVRTFLLQKVRTFLLQKVCTFRPVAAVLSHLRQRRASDGAIAADGGAQNAGGGGSPGAVSPKSASRRFVTARGEALCDRCFVTFRCMDAWMFTCMQAWMGGWVAGWLVGWVDGGIHLCQFLSPRSGV